MGLTRLKSRCGNLPSILKSPGENPFLSPFQLLEASAFLALGPSLQLQSQRWWLSSFHITLFHSDPAFVISPPSLTLLPSSSIFKDPCDYLGPAQMVQDNLPTLNSVEK